MGCLSACWAGITPTLVSQFIPVPQISGLRYRAKVQSLLPAIESSPPREFFLEFVQLDTHFTFSEIIHQCQDYFYVRICVDFSGEFGLLYLYTNTSYLHPEHCFWCADLRQDVTSSIVDVNTLRIQRSCYRPAIRTWTPPLSVSSSLSLTSTLRP